MKNLIVLLILLSTSCKMEVVEPAYLNLFPSDKEYSIINISTNGLGLDIQVCDKIYFIQEPGLENQVNSWWTIKAGTEEVNRNYWDGSSGTGIDPLYPNYEFAYGNGAWNHVTMFPKFNVIRFYKEGNETIVLVQDVDCIKGVDRIRS